MPNVNPKVGVWVNFAALILMGIAGGTIVFAGLPDSTVSLIKTYALDGVAVITAANLVFHLYSSPTPGPLAK